MPGEIDGPVIRFRVDAPQLQSAASGAFEPVKRQARQTTAQITDDWKRMSAQIRAGLASETLSTREVAAARRSIIELLNKEISLHRTKSQLSTRELANLKAMTLELERQKSHLAGTGGLTAGTHAAIGQFSTQTYLGVTRALDAIVNRYFGGAAGSIFRTVRDLGYYGSIGAHGAAGEGGGTSGFFSKLTSPVGLGVLGTAGALTAVGTALGVMAVKGGKLSVELTDLAHKTGLTTENAIKLRTVADVLGVSVDSLAVGFKRFDEQITAANAGNQQAAAIFRDLGINIQQAARDPYSAIQQLAVAFRQLPDGALKTAVATKLFGRGGQQLLPILSELAKVESLTKKSSEDLAHALGVDVHDAAIASRVAVENWKNETEALELAISQKLLPVLIDVIGIVNDAFSSTSAKLTTSSDVRGYLRSTLGAQFTPYGASEFRNFFATAAHPANAKPYQMFNAFFDFEAKHGVDASKLIEKYTKAVSDSGAAAGKASININKIQHDSANSKKTPADKIWDQIAEQIYRHGPARIAERRGTRAGGSRASRGIPIPGLGVGPESQTGNVLAGIVGPLGIGVSTGQTDVQFLQAILKSDYDKIFDTRDQEYRRELVQLKQALNQGKIQYQQYNTAVLAINDDLHKEMMRQNEEFNRQADQLFDQLISGDRNFGRTLVNDLRNAMLAPVRNMFDQVVGGLLGGFSRGVQGGFNGSIGSGLSRFATVPFLGRLIPGLNGNVPDGTASKPVHVVVGSGSGAGSGGIGGFLSSLFGGGSGLLTTSSNIGNLPLLGPGGSLAPGGGSGGILGFFKNLLGGGGTSHGGFFGLGGKLGGGLSSLGMIGGGLLMGLGAKTGGALGGLEGGAGGALSGALSGFMMGGPIGAAIGGIIGGIGGLISGIIGPSFQDRVRKSMTNQQYYLPPSETFSFGSNGSIASTLATGFSQSGGRFSQFGLPAGTPFWANAIRGPLSYGQYLALQNQQNGLYSNQPFLGFPNTNPYVGQGPAGSRAASTVVFQVQAIDAKGVADFLQQHGDTIARVIGGKVTASSSGFARNARRAVWAHGGLP